MVDQLDIRFPAYSFDMDKAKFAMLQEELRKCYELLEKKDKTISALKGHLTKKQLKNPNNMLVKIKPDTNVPEDQEVLAVNEKDMTFIGHLILHPKAKKWYCSSIDGIMPNVTHFVTIENLLKTK